MKFTPLMLLCGLALAPATVSQQHDDPALDGYVTRAASNSDFDVNGFRVICGPATQTVQYLSAVETENGTGCPQRAPFIGEAVSIYGSLKKKTLAIQAGQIDFDKPKPQASEAGSAVIDEILHGDSTIPAGGILLLQADGYRILIDAKAELKFTPPLDAIDKVEPGDWISYKGKLDQSSGILIAGTAVFIRASISNRELEFRARQEYDPDSVPSDSKQSKLKEAFGSIDPKKFPPFSDPQMQARLESIGNSLIPAYERNLPDSNPAKIHFRFHLIDANSLGSLVMPNGIILVPHQLVERMQNDSQLAALLADDMAMVLERIEFRSSAALTAATATGLAADVTMFALPPLDLVGIAAETTREEIRLRIEHQTQRASLDLMHAGGYDLNEAPRAWWRVATRREEPLAALALPEPVAYLYSVIGETWNHPVGTTASP